MTGRGEAAPDRWRQPLILLLGIGAVVLATLIGRQDVMGTILEPPLVGRLLLGAAAVLVGIVVSMRALGQFSGANNDARALVRAVRLVFLALAAFAAAAGWFLGSALPIVVALVIAGVDVIETTVLLLVVRPHAKEPDERAWTSGPDSQRDPDAPQ